MKLSDFIKELQKLEAQGYGEAQVFSVYGASGEVSELSSAHVSTEVTDFGPFDLKPNEPYISVYAGN